MKKIVFTISLALTQLPNTVMAHGGHGLSGIHWHATDVLGFVVAAALVGAAFYFGKK
jgi:hypothetical protein